MARSAVTITTCDGCGRASLAGADFQFLNLSAPGRLSTVQRWELCQDCAIWLDLQLQARLVRNRGQHAPVEIDMGS